MRYVSSKNNEKILAANFDSLGPVLKRRRVWLEQNGCCNKCKLATWLDKPITLEFEHKDGNRHNEVRENLEFLCPNCHSQTSTWRGRNVVKNGVTDAAFIEALNSTKNIRQALLKLGLAGGKNYQRARRLKTIMDQEPNARRVPAPGF